MKKRLLVIELAGVRFGALIQDEHFAHFVWLSQIGCFGTLRVSETDVHVTLLAIGEQLQSSGKQSFFFANPPCHSLFGQQATPDVRVLENVYVTMRDREWDLIHVSKDFNHMPMDLHCIDKGLGELLEFMDDRTAVLILSNENGNAGFILAVPGNSLQGPVQGVKFTDLLSTLTDLSELVIPEWMRGKSLVQVEIAQVDKEDVYSHQDEEEVYARLAGLGYIG